MATEPARFTPEWGVPPGEILEEALTERGMSQSELARRTNRPLKTINEIVRGKAAITPDTALQLELVLGIPARFWLNLERRHSEWQARQREQTRLEAEAAWARRFPLAAMVRKGAIPKSGSEAGYLRALLRFFAVTSPAAWERQWATMETAFRRSAAFRQSPEAVSVWLRWGEIEAYKTPRKPFNSDALENALSGIRELTNLDPIRFLPRLRAILSTAGVALALIPEFPGTHVSGAARWVGPERALVQLSLRHRTDDHFWFALIHEIRHLLRSGGRHSYLDSDKPIPLPDELDADRFSRDWLVPPDAIASFLEDSDVGVDRIRRFATEIGVSPGIIVGRLQHDRIISPAQFNQLKRKFKWSEE